MLAVDSPLLNFKMMELFAQARLPELVRGYLGEAPLDHRPEDDAAQGRAVGPGRLAPGRQVHGPGPGAEPVAVALALRRCGPRAGHRSQADRRLRHHPDRRGVAGLHDLAADGRGRRRRDGHPATDLRARRRAVLRRRVPAQDRLGPRHAQAAVRDRELVLRRLGASRWSTRRSRCNARAGAPAACDDELEPDSRGCWRAGRAGPGAPAALPGSVQRRPDRDRGPQRLQDLPDPRAPHRHAQGADGQPAGAAGLPGAARASGRLVRRATRRVLRDRRPQRLGQVDAAEGARLDLPPRRRTACGWPGGWRRSSSSASASTRS